MSVGIQIQILHISLQGKVLLMCDELLIHGRLLTLFYISSTNSERPTVVWAADLEPANTGKHCKVGQAAQAEQNATKGVDDAGHPVKQPPDGRGRKRQACDDSWETDQGHTDSDQWMNEWVPVSLPLLEDNH